MPNAVLLVLIPTVGVFVVALLGNLLSFGNRFVNALATAVILGLAWVAWVFVTQSTYPGIRVVFLAVFVVFIADLIGNLITFKSRFTNALATAAVFAVLFAVTLYALFMLLGPDFHGAGGS
jgi:hypothetical protein